MNKQIQLHFPAMIAFGISLCFNAQAQVPETMHYQGQVTVDGELFDGTGEFKFALVDGGTENVSTATARAHVDNGFVTAVTVSDSGNGYVATPGVTISGGGGSSAIATAVVENGKIVEINVDDPGSGYTENPEVSIDAPSPATIQTLWSHDGTSSEGGEPGSTVSLPVSGGVFSVVLGDTNLDGMDALPRATFDSSPVFMRVWFDDGSGGLQQLAPDQPVTATPYAMQAASVADGAISSEQIDTSIGLWSSAGGSFSTSDNVGIGIANPDVPLQVVGSSITGSESNEASGTNSFVTGGSDSLGENVASGNYSFAGGGIANTAGGYYSFLGGGYNNTADGLYSFIGGGDGNTATGSRSFVGGGGDNIAGGDRAFIGGGYNNTASGSRSFIGGGSTNNADGSRSFVGGGFDNTAAGSRSFVGGGDDNTAAAERSFVGGGVANTAGGIDSFVGGGSRNTAEGNRSFAAGYRAKARHEGTFVWADFTSADFESTAEDQFLIRADGGVGINTNSPDRDLVVKQSSTSNSSIGLQIERSGNNNNWGFYIATTDNLGFKYNDELLSRINHSDGEYVVLSDRRKKDLIEPLDRVLHSVLQLKPSSYFLKDDTSRDQRSIGLIAQEVKEVFPSAVSKQEGLYGISYGQIGVLTTAALIELHDEFQQKFRVREKEKEELLTELTELRTQVGDLTEAAEKNDARSEKMEKRLARMETLLRDEMIASR